MSDSHRETTETENAMVPGRVPPGTGAAGRTGARSRVPSRSACLTRVAGALCAGMLTVCVAMPVAATAAPPVVQREAARSVTDMGATFYAAVNPSGSDTTCQFEYVAEAAFQASGYATATSAACTPDDLGADVTDQAATATVTGLAPGTTYHFRVIATNADGTTDGDDVTFQTHVPFLVPLGTFGGPGSAAGQLDGPVGVAVDQHTRAVYVADGGNARIAKFSARGAFKGAWGWGVRDGNATSEVCTTKCQAGIAGSGAGQFSRPTSVAVDGSRRAPGNVYVGDAGNNVVVKLDARGNYLSTIDGSTTPQGPYSGLAGVAVDQSGNLWTVDAGTGNVDEFDSQGNFLQQWNDQFGFGTIAVAVDSTRGAAYVIRADGATARFTLTGVGPTPVDAGPGIALALDPETGSLYVDHGGDVAIYDAAGNRIDTLFSLGSTTTSQGLALRASPHSNGRQNRLYVGANGDDQATIYGPRTPGSPLVTGEFATSTGPTTQTLGATIVSFGHGTTCTFEYVDAADFLATGYQTATSVPCAPTRLKPSFTYQPVSASVGGLTLGAFYHYRVVATSTAGVATGADQRLQAGPGDWTPFYRCPVDDPAMLATDNNVTTLGLCLASNSSHGSIRLGNITTATGNTNLQAGVVGDAVTSAATLVPPAGGSLIVDPVEITSAGIPITAIVESAGLPTDFDIFAALNVGEPILTLPIKIHLVSPTLGPSCYIGSDQDPIVLHPMNLDVSGTMGMINVFAPSGFPDPNGPVQSLVLNGLVQGDAAFAVPGAQGCGPNGDGSLDGVVNGLAGLPSPAGNNLLVLDDASSALASGGTGQEFASYWHIGFGM